jgi:hypothetical protein
MQTFSPLGIRFFLYDLDLSELICEEVGLLG